MQQQCDWTPDMDSQDIRLARFWQRAVARLIDDFIVALSVSLLIAILMPDNSEVYMREFYRNTVVFVAIVIFYLLYYPILVPMGGTIGQRILSIRAVSGNDFGNISFAQSYKRSLYLSWPFFAAIPVSILGNIINLSGQHIVLIVSILLIAFFVISTIGPLAALWSRTNQGWHDSRTNTYVVMKHVS